jgi:hypothetical protein
MAMTEDSRVVRHLMNDMASDRRVVTAAEDLYKAGHLLDE